MSYNLKRALGIAFELYVATFIVGIVAGTVSGQDMSSMNNIPDSIWYAGMVAGVILTALFTMQYFRSPSIVPSAKSGLYFGLTAVVISFVLDFILFSIGNAGGAAEFDLGDYYSDYRFWVILILVVITAKLVGWYKASKTTTST
jgi:hypothetical protein